MNFSSHLILLGIEYIMMLEITGQKLYIECVDAIQAHKLINHESKQDKEFYLQN